jgi:hypothetical protein
MVVADTKRCQQIKKKLCLKIRSLNRYKQPKKTFLWDLVPVLKAEQVVHFGFSNGT